MCLFLFSLLPVRGYEDSGVKSKAGVSRVFNKKTFIVFPLQQKSPSNLFEYETTEPEAGLSNKKMDINTRVPLVTGCEHNDFFFILSFETTFVEFSMYQGIWVP